MVSLDDPMIRTWWDKVSKAAIECNLRDYSGIHEPIYHPVLSKYRVMCSQIRTEACYNYLCMRGFEMNTNGEIFLTEHQAIEYIEFQKMMED